MVKQQHKKVVGDVAKIQIQNLFARSRKFLTIQRTVSVLAAQIVCSGESARLRCGAKVNLFLQSYSNKTDAEYRRLFCSRRKWPSGTRFGDLDQVFGFKTWVNYSNWVETGFDWRIACNVYCNALALVRNGLR